MPHTVDSLRWENETLFANCVIRPERLDKVDWYIDRIVSNKSLYAKFGRIPWWLVGCIHAMESTFDFTAHLHNGDSLRRRTVNEPKGRPPYGTGPYPWLDSAKDALSLKGLYTIEDWDIAQALYQLERFNGWGYRNYHAPCQSPYLWSFSFYYIWGKYIRDGVFSPTAVSQQCGAAVILKRMKDRGLIEI